MVKDKKKKLSSEGSSTRDKMLARKKKLESRGNGGGLVYPKEGTLRMRIKSPGDDQELGIEIVQFYLGGDLGGVISPATFDEPCPFMEKYQELKSSKDDDDKNLAKLIVPRRRYVIGGIVYDDEKGTKVGYEGKDKGVLVPSSVYQDIIDLYLDEDEAGDMTDYKTGYDIKIKRSGSGKFDTTYSATQCKPTKLDKKYQGQLDLESIVRSQIKSYEELEEILAKFLKEDHGDDEDEEPKKKKLFEKKNKKDKKDEQIADLTDKLTRHMAEFDNYRKRTEKEKSAMYEIGAKDVVEKILPIVDNFERGLQSVPEEKKDDPFVDGMDKIYKQMMSTLEGIGVKPIEAVGQEFDPNFHNAVMHVEDEELGENVVAEEFQKGYMYRDSVVRHSMVKVAN